MKRKIYTELSRILKAEGVEFVDTTRRETHDKVHVRYSGVERFFVTPSSPSDVRGIKNWRADLRRWKRQVDEGRYP